MRTEQELREAVELFDWYYRSGRMARRDPLTQAGLGGTHAALDWVMGSPEWGENNPVAGTLADIRAMRKGPERN